MRAGPRPAPWGAAALAVGLAATVFAAFARESGGAIASPDAVAAGRKLFLRHCASCHGDDAAGTPRAPGLVGDSVKASTPDALERFLRNGRMARGMPSWSGLPRERRRQLVAYLESLQAP